MIWLELLALFDTCWVLFCCLYHLSFTGVNCILMQTVTAWLIYNHYDKLTEVQCCWSSTSSHGISVKLLPYSLLLTLCKNLQVYIVNVRKSKYCVITFATNLIYFLIFYKLHSCIVVDNLKTTSLGLALSQVSQACDILYLFQTIIMLFWEIMWFGGVSS